MVKKTKRAVEILCLAPRPASQTLIPLANETGDNGCENGADAVLQRSTVLRETAGSSHALLRPPAGRTVISGSAVDSARITLTSAAPRQSRGAQLASLI